MFESLRATLYTYTIDSVPIPFYAHAIDFRPIHADSSMLSDHVPLESQNDARTGEMCLLSSRRRDRLASKCRCCNGMPRPAGENLIENFQVHPKSDLVRLRSICNLNDPGARRTNRFEGFVRVRVLERLGEIAKFSWKGCIDAGLENFVDEGGKWLKIALITNQQTALLYVTDVPLSRQGRKAHKQREGRRYIAAATFYPGLR